MNFFNALRLGMRKTFLPGTSFCLCLTIEKGGGVVVEASVPKVYPRVTLASASTFSGSVVRTLRGGEGLSEMFCLVASSLGHLRSQCSIVCGSSLQRGSRRLA